ncbi:hypothetical protein GA0070624_3191 [Micromonospora rhizosphaerae]|uniref:Uncharacterized protein n=1 Tax=Micromonospora rhizosphaerae TaxID=568872 RepID=A0A1C6S8Q4_9ACTN|nr:hypothetical protein GA0070624_3191 [Micromonospora rhizosphaerae]
MTAHTFMSDDAVIANIDAMRASEGHLIHRPRSSTDTGCW